MLLNAYHEDVGFTLTVFRPGARWIAWIDTSRAGGLRTSDTYDGGTVYPLQARSMVVLMEEPGGNGSGNGSGRKEEANEAQS